ncbi:hypothetical protein [Conexibacter sp. DBS9H8]|uniref:hypothetical protein n=1 Tax=Conexibacter sp. DBS9H8 TaxID=2937801 RepID=UPI00200CDB94|nr:hypothetical protein [Conexibacter sp. DBS9H8]
MDDAEILTLLRRLARPHPSGGQVVERAAIMAAGVDGMAVIDWILDHDGVPETVVEPARNRGLHGARTTSPTLPGLRRAARYVLAAGTL